MIALKKEEEMELDLGLSIGGGFKRSEKVNHIKRESVQIENMNDQRTSCFNTVMRDNHPKISTDRQLERMGAAPQVKREIDAVRRQEAKKKRRKKQHHKGITKSEECLNGCFGVTHDDKIRLKSPKLETGESEFDVNDRGCKKSRVEDNESRNNNEEMTMKQVNLNLTVEQNINNRNQNVSSSSNPTAFSSPTVCPVMYPYPPIQFVQLPKGLPYPCVNVVPIWGNGVSMGSEQNSNVVQSLVNQSFRAFQSGNCHLLGFNVGDGCVSDLNSRKTGSRGSPMGSPSIVSDYQRNEGGGSSETRSHSNNSLPDQHYPLHGSKVNDKKGQSEHSASSPSREAAKVNDETANSTKRKNTSNDAQCSLAAKCKPNCIEKKIASNNVQLSPTNKNMEGVPTTENQSLGVLKESKRDIGKPPKPQIQNQTTLSLPQMPCVSTTGKGPNGKTINGFLYRYSKAEVSIICVCHGTSFSPAEFVQHAGGRDVSNPLKHITVIPSAF